MGNKSIGGFGRPKNPLPDPQEIQHMKERLGLLENKAIPSLLEAQKSLSNQVLQLAEKQSMICGQISTIVDLIAKAQNK